MTKSKYKRIIKRVLENKKNKQLMLTVPKDCGIKKDDFVEITKIEVISKNMEKYPLYPRSDVKQDKDGNLIEKQKKEKGEDLNE